MEIQETLEASVYYLTQSSSCSDDACNINLSQTEWVRTNIPCEGDGEVARNLLSNSFDEISPENRARLAC